MLFSTSGFAQQQVTVRLVERPMSELFDAIENQTDYRIFCAPEVSDSLIVTINETNAEPLALIRQALQDTDFQLSVFQNSVFIIRDRTLITALPESFHTRRVPIEEPENVLPVFEREVRATSETLIYTIGNPNAPSTTDVVVSGVVTSLRTGETLPGVTLLLEDPFIGATTDVFGFYSIRLPPGRHELIVRSVGMADTRRQLMLFSDGRLNIELDEQIQTLREVVVTASRTDNIRSISGGIERLQMRNIRNIPTVMGEADVLRIIMMLPGVTSVGEVSSGFNVRGGATDQNLVLFNDGTIFAPTHMFGLFSAFNPDVVDNMELHKSGIPASFGGRLSSVLDIRAREGNRNHFRGYASVGLLTSRLSLEGPLFNGAGSYIFGARTTYSDWLLEMIPEDSDFSGGAAGFHDFFGSVNYRFNENNIVFLNAYYSHNRFSFTEFDQYTYQNANFSVRWRNILNQRLVSTYVVGHDHFSFSNEDVNDIFNAYSIDFSINQLFGRADFTYFLDNRHTFMGGFSSMLYRLEPGNLLPAHESSIIAPRTLQTERALESAVHVSHEWEISPALEISTGIRYSIFNVLGQRTFNVYDPNYLPSLATILRTDTVGRGVINTWHGPEFRFSARYIIDENTSVRAGVNTMRQYIHKISNSSVMAPTDTWKLSDFNIRPKSGIQYTVGLARNFARNTIETSVEAYFRTINDFLDYRGGAQLFMNPHIETEVAGVRGRAYGVELMVRRPQGRLNGWISYAWSRTMLHRHPELASAANVSNWYPADFDRPHTINVVGNFRITHRYSLSLNADYSTGRPITVPISRFRLDNREYVFFSERNKYRIPDFFRMDLSFNIEYGHRHTRRTHSYITLGVYNVTGRRNAHSVFFVSEGRRIQGYKLSIFGAPIPYISYNIRF
jgi:hypothetical protein